MRLYNGSEASDLLSFQSETDVEHRFNCSVDLGHPNKSSPSPCRSFDTVVIRLTLKKGLMPRIVCDHVTVSSRLGAQVEVALLIQSPPSPSPTLPSNLPSRG